MSASQSDSSKYAVVRLRQNEDVCRLFQLLIENGYGEVSFVNALNETIFPTQPSTEKETQTISLSAFHQPIQIRQDAIQTCQSSPKSNSTGYISPQTACNAAACSVHPLMNATTQNRDKEDLRATREDRGLLCGSAMSSNGQRSITTLPTIPSSLLMQSFQSAFPVRQEQCAGSYSSSPFPVSLPSRSVTPPYSLPFYSQGFAFGSRPSTLPAQIALPLRNHIMGSPPLVLTDSLNVGPTSSSANAQQRHYYDHQQMQMQHRQHHHHYHQQQEQQKKQQREKEVSNVSVSDPYSSDTVLNLALLPGSATVQLRQRGQRPCVSDDPNLFIKCRMCKNKIMGSRISNLTNHVRRHSTLKQFQCVYCDYTHNEMAKVRLHMLHNHKDAESQPIDNITPEMQTAWDMLMRECFPERMQELTAVPPTAGGRGRRSLKHSGTYSDPPSEPGSSKCVDADCGSPSDSLTSNNDGKELTSPNSNLYSVTLPTRIVAEQQHQKYASCTECRQFVRYNDRSSHIVKYHSFQCVIYVCSLCGYGHSNRCSINLHIALKHCNSDNARVLCRDNSRDTDLLLPIYFPNVSPSAAALDSRSPNCASSSTTSLNANESPLIAEIVDVRRRTSEEKETALDCAKNFDKRQGVHQTLICHLCRKRVAGGFLKMIHHAKRHAVLKTYKCSSCHRYCSNSYKRVMCHVRNVHGVNVAKDQQPFLTRKVALRNLAQLFVHLCFYNPNSLKTVANGNVDGIGLVNNGFTKLSSTLQYQINWQSLANDVDDAVKRSCKLCRRSVNVEDVVKHVRRHLPYKTYGCSLCSYISTNLLLARAHIWKHELVSKKSSSKTARVVYRNSFSKSQIALCFDNLNKIKRL